MLVVINKDSLMRGGRVVKLHGPPWQLLFALHQTTSHQWIQIVV